MSEVKTKSRDLSLRGVKIDRPMTGREALQRWPRIVAHMICESLGYFTPKSASNALASYKNGEDYGCEWYSSMSYQRTKNYFNVAELIKINKDVVKWSFLNRRRHTGYMADYATALALVRKELETKDGLPPSVLASWF